MPGAGLAPGGWRNGYRAGINAPVLQPYKRLHGRPGRSASGKLASCNWFCYEKDRIWRWNRSIAFRNAVGG